MKRSFALFSSLAAALPFAHVAAARTPVTIAQTGPLRSSCTDATGRILDWAAYMAVESRFYRVQRPTDLATRPPVATAEKSDAAAGRSAPGHTTTTNVQEVGVDEADLVKTDGKYVYTVNGREVVIVRSWPAARAHVVARYALPENVTPQNLFLEDDRLVVLSHIYDRPVARSTERVARPHEAGFHGTRISILDIAERTRPRLVHQADIEGNMVQARMIGDDVYLVSNAAMQVPAAILEAAEWKAKRLGLARGDLERMHFDKPRAYRAVRAHLEATAGRADVASVLPRVRRMRPGGGMSPFRPLYSCADLFVPEGGAQLGTLDVVHFDVDAPERMDAVGILASGWQVYASTDALYAAMPNFGWSHIWGWGSEPRAADFNLTNIHKFDLRGDGNRPVYAASGRVRGHILNQFSMSEHDGYLRVATTDQTWGGRGETGNHLYVLAERGRRLTAVGAIEDLAPGERIFSARMMGDKGTMVTFKQTDPLFTLDLSNPRRPRVAGELKINGFSSYIHPLDGDRLLTIGQDATDQGRVRGAHVQVFDVSDPERPRRTAHRLLTDDRGTSWSAAQWDHHAFTYDPRTRVLAVPVSTWSNEPFHGLVLLQVGDDSLREIGRISHLGLAEKLRGDECVATEKGAFPCATPAGHDGRAQIVRSIVMDDVILSLSNLGLQANVLAHPERTLAQVLLVRSPSAGPAGRAFALPPGGSGGGAAIIAE